MAQIQALLYTYLAYFPIASLVLPPPVHGVSTLTALIAVVLFYM